MRKFHLRGAGPKEKGRFNATIFCTNSTKSCDKISNSGHFVQAAEAAANGGNSGGSGSNSKSAKPRRARTAFTYEQLVSDKPKDLMFIRTFVR